MRLKYLYILLLLVPVVCGAQGNRVDCDSSNLTIDEKHIELLHDLINSAKTSKGEEKVEFERQFFCAMPNSFDKMIDLLFLESTMTYNRAKAKGKLPIIALVHPFVDFFSQLKTIAPDQYYEKYINMCVDGFYGADDIREGFQIYKRFETDTKAICNVLVKRNDKDIKSVFRFIFDSSHPENEVNEDIYDTIYPLVNKENKHLGALLKDSFETLIKEKRH